MSILLLRIAAVWPHPAQAEWVLLDDTRQVIREGCSVPAGWPAASRCELLLTAQQLALHEVRLPQRVRRRDLSRLLAYALQDRLLEDSSQVHITLLDKTESTARVVVINRNRLNKILRDIQHLGRQVAAVWCEQQVAWQAQPGDLLLSDKVLFWRDHASLLVLENEPPDSPADEQAPDQAVAAAVFPQVLSWIAKRAAQQNIAEVGAPLALPVLVLRPASHLPALSPQTLKEWQHNLALADAPATLKAGEAWRWHAVPARATNLLHDDFAPQSGDDGLWARLRLVRRLALALFLLFIGVEVGQVLWQQSQLAELRERQAALFRQVMPANTPMLNPLGQILSARDAARSRQGLLRHDDFLTLLAQAGAVLPANSLVQLEYQNGNLKLLLNKQQTAQLPRLRAQLLAQTGWQTGGGSAEQLKLQVEIAP